MGDRLRWAKKAAQAMEGELAKMQYSLEMSMPLHVGLVGGTLTKEGIRKDVDFILYPWNLTEADIHKVNEMLGYITSNLAKAVERCFDYGCVYKVVQKGSSVFEVSDDSKDTIPTFEIIFGQGFVEYGSNYPTQDKTVIEDDIPF